MSLEQTKAVVVPNVNGATLEKYKLSTSLSNVIQSQNYSAFEKVNLKQI